jgi:hypothetical protein
MTTSGAPDWTTKIDNLTNLHTAPPNDTYAWALPDQLILLRACNTLLSSLPFMSGLSALITANESKLLDLVQGITAFLQPLHDAINAFVHAFDNIDWTNPATIIPTLIRDAITACWNLFWTIFKWCIEAIDLLTNLNALSGVGFLQGLGNWLELPTLKTVFNTLLSTWTSLDFAGAPLTALPLGFQAFVTFLAGIISWVNDVIAKILGIIFPGWFHWAELGAVWTQYRTILQPINWLDIPTALFTFATASITALQGIGRWILDVFTGLIGSSATVIHQMFASPIAFLNQMILHFFGSIGLAKWHSALDFFTGLTGSTPIAALNAVFAQFQGLGTLFGNLTSGNLIGWLTTFFQNFSTNFSSLPTTLQGDLTSLFTAVGDMGQQVLDTLINFFTGSTGSGNSISALIPALRTWGNTILSDVMAPMMSAIGNISVSNLIGAAQNLLLNPGFSGAVSLSDPNNAWTWDDTVFLSGLGVAAPGSAKVTASGVLQALRSNTIAVTAGKTLNAAITVLANGLVATGLPLRLEAITEAGNTVIASTAAPAATPSSWTGAPPTAKSAVLSGNYTVPSSGVSTLTLRLVVDSTATAGTVWFDGANLATTGLLQNTLVTGIGGIPDLGSTLQQTWDTVAGAAPGAGTLPAILTRLTHLNTAGIFDNTGVSGIGGIGNIGASLQQTWDQLAAALPNAGTLALVGQRLQNLASTGLFDASQLFNTANIPALPIANVTSLSGYLTHLNTSGLLSAVSGLTGTVPIGQIPTGSLNKSNIADLGTTYTAAQRAGAVAASMTCRGLGTPVTVTANTASPYTLAGYFDTTDYTATGISSFPASSQFNVSVTGYYRCDICYNVAGGAWSAIWNIAPVLFKNSVVYKFGHDAISFYTVATGGVTVRMIHSSFTVPLTAGDSVQAGVHAHNASGTISNVLASDATGAQAYFTISLINQQVP